MMANTQASIDRVCEYRGLPKIKKGAMCEVNGRGGLVWGGNSAANLNVKFNDTLKVYNCHPGFKMRIFKDNGELIHDSNER